MEFEWNFLKHVLIKENLFLQNEINTVKHFSPLFRKCYSQTLPICFFCYPSFLIKVLSKFCSSHPACFFTVIYCRLNYLVVAEPPVLKEKLLSYSSIKSGRWIHEQ